jgi:large subunit ribosomal protein L2
MPQGVRPGDKFLVGQDVPVSKGNRLPLKKIPAGTFVFNVEIHPRGGAKLIRSAGSFAEVLSNDAGYTLLKMPSTEVRKVDENSFATVGAVSNEEYRLANYGKAGRSRWKGIRPTVRGTAMNPVDHPHGGGEGRQGRGRRRAVSMWGKNTGKGHKTRTPKKYSNHLVVTRRKVGKKR